MKNITYVRVFCLFYIFSILFSVSYCRINITGAGSTLPSPLYSQWAASYFAQNKKKINYQSIGSSAGIRQIMIGTVDFGASDIPLQKDDLEKNQLAQFPSVIGGVVLTVNLPGIESLGLILDVNTVGEIYLGRVKNWNDDKISRLNPNLVLPPYGINAVHRSDGSGTSFVFTQFLASSHQGWQSQVGAGTTVNWPVGLGGKGNDGVATFIQKVPYSVGYVEYSFAQQSNLNCIGLVTKNGDIVYPSKQNFIYTVNNLKKGLSLSQIQTEVWPISTTTFILFKNHHLRVKHNIEILRFFIWSYMYGQNIAQNLHYVMLQRHVAKDIIFFYQSLVKQI